MLIRRQRLDRAIKAMNEQNVDMWISYARSMQWSGEPMLRYLLTFDMGGPVAVILTKNGDKIVINSRMEIEELESMGIFTKVIENNDKLEGMKKIVRQYVDLLKPQKIALNFSDKDDTSDGLSCSGYKMLSGAFYMAKHKAEIIPSHNLMKYVRGNRSREEVERIRYCVQKAMEIYDLARPHMKKGMSGMDIQRLFQALIDQKGYEYSWDKYGNPFNSIGTKSSYLCKRPADDVFIEGGDVVNVDLGIKINGASSDNQRTFYALREGEKEAPYEVKKAFDTLGEVNLAVAKHMMPGVKAGDVLKYANEIFVKNGYKERSGAFGHEIGFYAHDGVIAPCSERSEPEIDSSFLEGMTFTLEPAIVTSFGRVCREDVFAVTDSGGEILSTLQDYIWLIE